MPEEGLWPNKACILLNREQIQKCGSTFLYPRVIPALIKAGEPWTLHDKDVLIALTRQNHVPNTKAGLMRLQTAHPCLCSQSSCQRWFKSIFWRSSMETLVHTYVHFDAGSVVFGPAVKCVYYICVFWVLFRKWATGNLIPLVFECFCQPTPTYMHCIRI